MNVKNALSLLLAAGVIAPAMADTTPDRSGIDSRLMKVSHNVGGHIYVNAKTGERIVLEEQSQGLRGAGPTSLWAADVIVPCEVLNTPENPDLYVFASIALVDDPANGFEEETWLNWGDSPANTVVDGIRFGWSNEFTVPGGVSGDPVPGLGAIFAFYDGYDGGEIGNGFNPNFQEITGATFAIEGLTGSVGGIQLWTYTLDLAADGLDFELGDDDGVSTATNFNAFGFSDDDFDGSNDFGWSFSHVQPGNFLDENDQPIGDPNNNARTFAWITNPRGTYDSDNDLWIVDQSFPGGARGSFDAFTIYNSDGTLFEIGGSPAPLLAFGGGFGFSCDVNGNGIFEGDGNANSGFPGIDDAAPWANFLFEFLAGEIFPPEECLADFNGDESVNVFDVFAFLVAYATQDPAADLAAPFGTWNVFDVFEFLDIFSAGCP